MTYPNPETPQYHHDHLFHIPVRPRHVGAVDIGRESVIEETEAFFLLSGVMSDIKRKDTLLPDNNRIHGKRTAGSELLIVPGNSDTDGSNTPFLSYTEVIGNRVYGYDIDYGTGDYKVSAANEADGTLVLSPGDRVFGVTSFIPADQSRFMSKEGGGLLFYMLEKSRRAVEDYHSGLEQSKRRLGRRAFKKP